MCEERLNGNQNRACCCLFPPTDVMFFLLVFPPSLLSSPPPSHITKFITIVSNVTTCSFPRLSRVIPHPDAPAVAVACHPPACRVFAVNIFLLLLTNHCYKVAAAAAINPVSLFSGRKKEDFALWPDPGIKGRRTEWNAFVKEGGCRDGSGSGRRGGKENPLSFDHRSV